MNGREPKDQRAPAKPPAPSEDDSVAVLRVSAWTTAPPDLPALQLEIRRLERKLAELKRIERSVASAELTKD